MFENDVLDCGNNEMENCLITKSIERGHGDCKEDSVLQLIANFTWLNYSGAIQYKSQPCHYHSA
jgi:hypothetical protein